jgi:hypothetical protein
MNELTVDVHNSPFKQDWVTLWRQLMSDLKAKAGSNEFDAFEAQEFTRALVPLRDRVLRGLLDDASPEVWQVRYFIRNAKFRPTYEELSNKVYDVLGMARVAHLEGGVAQSRVVYKAESPLQIEGSTEKTIDGKWIKEFPPSGNNESDLFLVNILSTVERAAGSDVAVTAARSMRKGRTEAKNNEQKLIDGILGEIPHDLRIKYTNMHGGFNGKFAEDVKTARNAVQSYKTDARNASNGSAVDEWKKEWRC